MDANTIILFALGMVQAVIAFFLKRILAQLDMATRDITGIFLKLSEDYVRKPELEELKKQLSDLRHWKIGIQASRDAEEYLRTHRP